MVTGIIWDAAVAATTMVGAEAAAIIMDGDIADGTSYIYLCMRPPR